ncbi:MAG: hypothetical protein ACT4QE_18965 [Anaerolineales bacterium]
MSLWRSIVFVLLAIALFAAPATVHACTPPPGGLPAYTATDRTIAAPIVLEGTVIAVQFDPVTSTNIALIEVKRYFKGIGPQYLSVNRFGDSSMCLSWVNPTDTRIFYIEGDEASGYSAFYLSQFDATAPNDEQTVTEVIAASGQEPSTDFTPYQRGTPDAIFTQAAATQIGPTLTALAIATPTPYVGPPPFISTPIAPSNPANVNLTLLGVGGVVGFLLGVIVGLITGFGLSFFLRRGE